PRHRLGALEQLAEVDADQRRGHEPEHRQRREAPADRRVAGEDLTVALLARDGLELRARVGDRDETAARGLLADARDDAVPEVRVEDVRLERRARLARDDDE